MRVDQATQVMMTVIAAIILGIALWVAAFVQSRLIVSPSDVRQEVIELRHEVRALRSADVAQLRAAVDSLRAELLARD